jgi:hypothetical protein
MYVRSKITKGRTYYQIVAGVRDGERVRQQIVLTLGRTADPRKALEEWKGRLKSLQTERDRWTPGVSKTTDRRIERLNDRIGKLKVKVEELDALIKVKLIGTTEKVTGTMERDISECGVRYLAIKTRPRRSKAKK